MEKKNLEQKLKSEGKRLAPNVLNKVYDSLDLEFSSSKNVQVETKLKEEGKILVKNQYDKVAVKTVNKKLDNKFLLFIKNPITISVSATFLVAAVSASIVLPILLNRSTTPPTQTDALVTDNSVTLDLTSASKAYNAKMKFVINSEGNVDPQKVITLDDTSAYLIDKYNVAPTSRVGSYTNEEKFTKFTNNYLSTALNYGYLEKLDYTKTNNIVFKVTTSGKNDTQFSTIKKELSKSVESFIEENKIILEYEIEEVQSDVYSLFSEDEYDKASLIIDMYDLATRLFVGTNKTLTEAYFSSEIEDWVTRFKDVDERILEEYVFMLGEFNNYVEGVEQRDRFIDEFYMYSQNFLDELPLFNSYLPIMEQREAAIKEELKTTGSAEIMGLLDGSFENLARYLNQKYAKQKDRIDLRFKPTYETKVWDIFDDGYHAYEEKQPGGHSFVPVEEFKQYLENHYSVSEYEKTEQGLFNLYLDLQNLISMRNTAIHIIDDNFIELVIEIIDQHMFETHWNDDEYSHHHEEPSGWDDHFNDWWDDRPHDRDHH